MLILAKRLQRACLFIFTHVRSSCIFPSAIGAFFNTLDNMLECIRICMCVCQKNRQKKKRKSQKPVPSDPLRNAIPPVASGPLHSRYVDSWPWEFYFLFFFAFRDDQDSSFSVFFLFFCFLIERDRGFFFFKYWSALSDSRLPGT